MIKIEEVDVYGWEAAIRGMRNPMNSWDKSDSGYAEKIVGVYEELPEYAELEFVVGDNDLKLMRALSKAGSDHGKFLRMITVTLDITAPLYWWKEFDTYKVGTVANSCSTMHKIHDKEFELDDFSHEHLSELGIEYLKDTVSMLNRAREAYLKTKDKLCWWDMIQLLPTSYNQKRTVQLNYQVLKSMYHARKAHKLDEWVEFCNWCETLPYFRKICIDC